MTRTAEQIAALLNEYEGGNIWQDVILGLDEYDETRTAAIDPSYASNRVALADGSEIGYDEPSRAWYVAKGPDVAPTPRPRTCQAMTDAVTQHARDYCTPAELARVRVVVHRGWGDNGPRSWSPSFTRGVSELPSFGDGWVIAASAAIGGDAMKAALGMHLMFLADEHLAEDVDGHLAACGHGIGAFAARVPAP